MSDRIRALHCTGSRSGRSFTRDELIAAKRLGYATKRHSKWDGAVFWATGKVHLDDLRRMKADIETLLPAWEREWDKWKEQADE